MAILPTLPVSAAHVVQAAVPICECSWTRRCFGPDPVLRNWIVIGRSTSVWGPDRDPTATRFRGVTWPIQRSELSSVRRWFRNSSWFSRGTLAQKDGHRVPQCAKQVRFRMVVTRGSTPSRLRAHCHPVPCPQEIKLCRLCSHMISAFLGS